MILYIFIVIFIAQLDHLSYSVQDNVKYVVFCFFLSFYCPNLFTLTYCLLIYLSLYFCLVG